VKDEPGVAESPPLGEPARSLERLLGVPEEAPLKVELDHKTGMLGCNSRSFLLINILNTISVLILPRGLFL